MNYLLTLSIILLTAFHGQSERKTKTGDPDEKGIHFEKGLSWEQILAKARQDHKYIFVDCYATWCGPCKQMDRDIYPKASVGQVFNDRFISVKIQMDSTSTDRDDIKSRYADAHYLLSHYKVEALPTFLFFTPDGQLVNRSMGTHKEEAFTALAKETTDPEKNYYTLLRRYREGRAGLEQIGWLTRQALLLGDTVNSREMAKAYILRLNREDALLTRPNLEYMKDFTKSSADKSFSIFYRYADSIDAIMGDDVYAQQLVHTVLYKEIVIPELEKAAQSGSQPDWNQLASAIEKKYSPYYAERVITAARSTWASDHENWPEYTHYLVQYMEKFGTRSNQGEMTSLILNNYAWEVFKYSHDQAELRTALSWSRRAVMMHPLSNWMDTYANLLYKLGRKEEALTWEGLAAQLDANGMFSGEIQNNLAKMKEGEPTWASFSPKQ